MAGCMRRNFNTERAATYVAQGLYAPARCRGVSRPPPLMEFLPVPSETLATHSPESAS